MGNNVLIGKNAGADLPIDAENIVIIGDDIRDMDHSNNKDVVYIGKFVAIGKTIGGIPCNLHAILAGLLKNINIADTSIESHDNNKGVSHQ